MRNELEHGWSRVFLNTPGFLACLDKVKYGWISLNMPKIKRQRYRKVILKLDSIHERKAHSELYRTSKMELFQNTTWGLHLSKVQMPRILVGLPIVTDIVKWDQDKVVLVGLAKVYGYDSHNFLITKLIVW